jgi:hypothetical protein
MGVSNEKRCKMDITNPNEYIEKNGKNIEP